MHTVAHTGLLKAHAKNIKIISIHQLLVNHYKLKKCFTSYL